jgi:uncharacterized protein (TIGR02611 family)
MEFVMLSDSFGTTVASKVAIGGVFFRSETAEMLLKSIQQTKRFLKVLFGFTLLLVGIVMIVTPGPGWLVMVLGLGVLAAEFVWARRLLGTLKEHGERLKDQGLRLRDTFLSRMSANRI